VVMSQEAYSLFTPQLKDNGLLIIERDLVRVDALPAGARVYSVPATRLAEELGQRVVLNVVMVGFFGAVAGVLNADSPVKGNDDAVASAFESWLSLTARGKDPAQFPACMPKFAAHYVRNGRHVWSRTSSRDVISRTAQQRRGFTVESLPLQGVEWGEILIDDALTPVPDQVAFRLDFPAFRKTLTPRNRKILDALAMGDSGKEVAERFGLTPPRVTQLRQQWQREWEAFVGESESAEWPADQASGKATAGSSAAPIQAMSKELRASRVSSGTVRPAASVTVLRNVSILSGLVVNTSIAVTSLVRLK